MELEITEFRYPQSLDPELKRTQYNLKILKLVMVL